MERLRAALSPHVMTLLLALVVLALLLGSGGENGAHQLEVRASQVLSQVQGAGKVSVVISMRSQEGQRSSMSIQNQVKEQVPSGAVAVAQGAEDPFVCAQLTQALCALLGLPASSVSVISGG